MFAAASSPCTVVAGASIAPAAAPIIATASRRLTGDESAASVIDASLWAAPC
jgi:hypothetical protein